MAPRLRSSTLDTRTARKTLPVKTKPYWCKIAPGISLGYRRNIGAGTWSLRAADGKGGNWTKVVAVADDMEDSNGKTVLTFVQAADKARALARGGDGDTETGALINVDGALTAYAGNLAIRRANPTNATQPRYHLSPALLQRPVAMLTVTELMAWRDSLITVLKVASINRICKSLKAAFNLAARRDPRIKNAASWKVGLEAIPEPDDITSNLVLNDEQRRATVACAYALNADLGLDFGLYVEVHAVTGARSSQIAALNVDDLQLGAMPRLMMPSSLKGKNRTVRTRKPMPIPAGLAQKLKAAAAGRADNAPLLLHHGKRWPNSIPHRRPFIKAAKAAGLPADATIYCLRHTAITRTLLAGVAVRLVASSFDTSIAIIEKHYSKFISDHGDEKMREAMFDAAAPAADNVIAIAA